MKINEIIKLFENYYGAYTPIVKRYLAEYLKSEYKESDLLKLSDLVIKSYSGQYKYPPDVAIIEKIVNEYNKHNDYPSDRIEKRGSEIKYLNDYNNDTDLILYE